MDGGDSNVKQWLKDEGVDSSVSAALKVCPPDSIQAHHRIA